MRRVLLTGTYCSQNKGDGAMQIATAHELRRRGVDVSVAVASPFPEIDRPVYAAHGLEVVTSHRRKLGRVLAHMALGSCRRSLVQAIRTPDVAAIASADLVLDLSGDGLTEDYGPHVVLSHLYPVWLALELGKPVMLCAQTIGPFRRLGPLVRRILDRVECITPRDRHTEEGLWALGVRRPRMERTADVAHLLEAAPVALPALEGGPVLGVTVSRLLGHRQSLGWLGRSHDALEALARALEGMIERHGFRVLLLAHSTGPRPARDDRHITRRLASRLGRPARVQFVEEDLGPAEVKGLIGRCDLFCAMRLHSAVAALSLGIPCVVLGYGPKAAGLMESWGQAGGVLPVAGVEGAVLLAALEETWRSRLRVRAELAERREGLLERARANVDIALSLLG